MYIFITYNKNSLYNCVLYILINPLRTMSSVEDSILNLSNKNLNL